MERLTNKREADAQRREYENRLKNGYPRNIPEERFLKLAAYEDTGLEPEEVTEYQRLCDSYVEAGLDAKFIQFCIDATRNGLSINRICELAQAEKDGRLVVLPCKVGTPIWEIGDFDDGNLKKRPFGVEDMSFWRFGTTVFLTREEAEAALEKREEADNETD